MKKAMLLKQGRLIGEVIGGMPGKMRGREGKGMVEEGKLDGISGLGRGGLEAGVL